MVTASHSRKRAVHDPLEAGAVAAFHEFLQREVSLAVLGAIESLSDRLAEVSSWSFVAGDVEVTVRAVALGVPAPTDELSGARCEQSLVTHQAA